MKKINEVELEQIVAGNKQNGEIYLNAISGGVEGAMICMDAGAVFGGPWVMAGCAAGGAILGAMFPH